MKNIVSLILLLFLFSGKLFASHIAGGELTYVCNAVGKYTVTLIMYRNCNAAYPLQSEELLSYNHLNGTDNAFGDRDPVLEIISDNYNDPCASLPDDICLEKGTYIWDNIDIGVTTGLMELFVHTNALSDDYIDNVDFTGPAGVTYNATIPGIGASPELTCHTSPTFNSDPPAIVCFDYPNEIDLSCTPSEPTNTLVYEFFTPYDQNPELPSGWDPTINDWDTILWETGFEAIYPFGQPAPYPDILTTNLTTDGIIELTISPGAAISTLGGSYYCGVRVLEYDSLGNYISEIHRTFTYIVANCNINVAAMNIPSSTPVNGKFVMPCGELTVDFQNQSSNSNSFIWDFGDVGSSDNASADSFPSHTFSDYGTYDVSLVSYADEIECADSIITTIEILEPISGIIALNDPQCLAANSFDFELEIDQDYPISVVWNFGTNASIPNSSNLTPTGVTYNATGVYTVTANVSFGNCESQISTTVTVFDGLLDQITGPNHACDPELVTFIALNNISSYEYTWYINGDTLTGASVQYYFTETGLYDVALYVFDTENGCESFEQIDDYIYVFPTPISSFEVNDFEFTIGEQLEIKNISEKATNVSYTIPTIGFASIQNDTRVILTEVGQHTIIQTAYNGECVHQTTITIDVSPRKPMIPNAFTPNGDMLNDFFYIDPYHNEDIKVDIYDRWGQKVFHSDNYEYCSQETGEACWGGYNSFTDKKCSKGHYFYIIQLVTGESYKGSIHLL